MIITTNIIDIETTQEDEMIDVTNQINNLLNQSGITVGHIALFVPHTTAAITINENADPDVKKDILLGLRKSFPKDIDYVHYEGNSHAHIKSSVIGVDEKIIVSSSEMILGTWQGIYFMEFDGPRSRKLVVRIEGQ